MTFPEASGPVTHSDLDRLAEEYVERLRRGEDAPVAAYEAAHPALAERIGELFPLLALMEGLKPEAPAAETLPEEGAAPRPPVERVGGYEIVRLLGSGGMGRVFEAVAADGTRVALKLIHPHLVDRAGYLARFLREIEAGERVDDHGVVHTLGSGITEIDGMETPYIVLEYVEGQNLRDLLGEISPLSERLCRHIGAAIADALTAIHAAGMVHRDIKPENVVITPDETIKLMDLGIALLQEEAFRLSKTGEFVGSLLYAAPEQLRGQTADARTDLYGLGVLLYELATGSHPGSDDPAGRVGVRSTERSAPSARAVQPGVSPFLDAVIGTLLAPDPDDRFENALQVAVNLRVGEDAPWWQERTGELVGRRPWLDYERPTSLHGRDDELRVLDAAHHWAGDGRGRVVIVKGEGGIGKSRLVHEWLDRMAARSGRVPWIFVAKHVRGGDVHPTRALARGLLEGLGEEDLEERLRGWLGHDTALAGPLAAVLRGDVGESLPSGISKESLDTAFLLLLRALAREQGAVVVVEDLHNASVEARDTFAALARAVASDPILLIGTRRPRRESALPEDLGQLDHVQVLGLEGLDARASHDLIEEALGERAAGSSGVSRYARNAQGSPFCLIEFARELKASKSLSVSTRTGAPADDLSIPSAVRSLMEVRLGGLTPEARSLLEIAACCGDEFDPTPVLEAAEIGRIQGLRTLHELDRTHDLLRSEGTNYRFQHHLMRETLYEELTPALRAAYHGALGAVLEARAREREAEGMQIDGATAYAVSRHLLLGDEPAAALPFVGQGVRHLYDIGAFRLTARMAKRVLAIGDAVSDDVRALSELLLGAALLDHAPPGEGIPHLEEALRLGEKTGDSEVALWARVDLAAALRQEGRNHEGRRVAAAAIEGARAAGDRLTECSAHINLAICLLSAGRLEDARDAARAGTEIGRELRDAALEGEASAHLGGILLELGELEEARLLLDHAVHLGQICGNAVTESNALSLWSKLAYIEGRPTECLDMQVKLRNLGRSRGLFRQEIVALVNITQIEGDLGRFEASLESGRQAMALAERMEYPDAAGMIHLGLGSTRAALGAFEDAEADWRRTLVLADELGAPPMEVRAKRRLGPLLAWTGRFEEGRAVIESGAEVATAGGAAREIAEAWFARAEAAHAQDLCDDALAALDEASAVMEKHGFTQSHRRVDLLRGEILLSLGRGEEARLPLEAAAGRSDDDRIEGFHVNARVLLGAVPGGDGLKARMALNDDGARLPAHARMRAMWILGNATADAGLCKRAAADLAVLVESAPAAQRDKMRTQVPLHARILRSTES